MPSAPQSPAENPAVTGAGDRDAVRELLAQYCFRLDDGRFAEIAELFTEDGTWDTAFGKAVGRAAIADLARSLRLRAGPDRPRAVHLVSNISVALTGERATARSNWMVMENAPGGPKIGSGGAYFDELTKASGAWRFHYRRIDRFIAA
jgi:SnoaL-like protein